MSAASTGEVAVVTGGTGALGRAVVTELLATGVTVAVPWVDQREHDRLRGQVEAVSDRVVFREVDLRRADRAEAFVAEIEATAGPVTRLANLAGGFAYGPFVDAGPEVWDRMIALNLTTSVNCCRAVLGPMRNRRWGRIVNVSAIPALTGGGANMTAYSAAKGALLNLTQSLSAELAGSGVTINAVLPTIIDTEANRRAMPDADRSTWLAPDRIAKVIGFLLGPDAGIVTGSAVRLSAG